MTTPTLHPDFRQLIGSLIRHGARFVIVGAHALAYHGRPRNTDDLDILVAPDEDNAKAVASALRDFGGFTELADRLESHLTEPDRMASIGRPPVAVDLLTSISGVSFDEAWSTRIVVDVDDMSVPFLALAQYVANKKASGRPKDRVDLELLHEAGLLDDALEGPLLTTAALAELFGRFTGHLTGARITSEEAAELQNVGMPVWLTDVLQDHPLVGTEWYLSELLDESGLGVEMQLMSPAEVLDECRNALPGQVACRLGFVPLGTCLVGSGDPYFLMPHPALDGAKLVRVPHEITEEDFQTRIEIVSRELHSFFERAELG